MARYISLIRGINVTGHNKIFMADLKAQYESLGFQNIKTYIQSGNVVFDPGTTDLRSIKIDIESAIRSRFGYDVGVLIKTPGEFRRLIEGVPFETDSCYVTFLFDSPGNVPVSVLDNLRNETEQIEVVRDVVYIRCPSGYGRSKLSNNQLEKKLGVSTTTRNWNTVSALMKLIDSD